MNIALIVILITTVAMSFKGFDDRAFFSKYQFHIGSIRSGEYLRLFSWAFLHADISHLAFNMYTLYLFAPIVIVYLGTLSFVIIYFTSLLVYLSRFTASITKAGFIASL